MNIGSLIETMPTKAENFILQRRKLGYTKAK